MIRSEAEMGGGWFRLASLSRVSSASEVWAAGGKREAKKSGRYILPAASRFAISSASRRNASKTEKRLNTILCWWSVVFKYIILYIYIYVAGRNVYNINSIYGKRNKYLL